MNKYFMFFVLMGVGTAFAGEAVHHQFILCDNGPCKTIGTVDPKTDKVTLLPEYVPTRRDVEVLIASSQETAKYYQSEHEYTLKVLREISKILKDSK
jgi:hypothetical protein